MGQSTDMASVAPAKTAPSAALEVTANPSGHPVGVVGAGLVGLAVARELVQARVPVVVFEKETAVAQHQSGHNSGVVHAGIYYLPGSAKATMCRRAVELLRAYCADRGLPWDARGKLVVARDEAETAKLREIERRAAANGVPGVRWLDAPEIRELEPDIAGVAALLSPTTAIVDYPAIARSFADDVTGLGGQVLTGTPVSGVHRRDPAYPFLGVHLTPRIDGEVDIGPNAVLALAREGYRRRDVSRDQLSRLARSAAFHRLARQNWRAGVREMHGSVSRRAFLAEARTYLPWLGPGDVMAAPAGVRAQAVDPDGSLVGDFRIHRIGSVTSIRNAPSPAATASLAIAERIVAELFNQRADN